MTHVAQVVPVALGSGKKKSSDEDGTSFSGPAMFSRCGAYVVIGDDAGALRVYSFATAEACRCTERRPVCDATTPVMCARVGVVCVCVCRWLHC